MIRIRHEWCAGAILFVLLCPLAVRAGEPSVSEIVTHSLEVTRVDWQHGLNAVDIERDEDFREGKNTSSTYQIMMIDGTPYNHLIARDGKTLSAAEEAQQTQLMQQECEKRANESAEERAKRVAKYRRSRQRMFEMMREMTRALNFTLTGEATVDGHEVYVLRASPRPGYQPTSRETRVLTAMKGTLWIDKKSDQWVRVEAEVIKPVWFGLFIAKVNPGTKFLLEQEPVEGNLWLPRHFRMQVNSAILFNHRNFTHDETYRDYRILAPGGMATGSSASSEAPPCRATGKPVRPTPSR